MADLTVLRLGPVDFEPINAGAFEELQRLTRWRIDQPDVIEGMGRPRPRGRASDRITISGRVMPGFVGSADSVERLRDLGDAGESRALTDGLGRSHGHWIVTAVRERQRFHLPGGSPRQIDFDVSLTRDPEEELPEV